MLFLELHKYGGGLVEDGRDSSSVSADSKQVGSSSKVQDVTASLMAVAHPEVYGMGVPSQRSGSISQRQGPQRPSQQKWKGPDKSSRIYGDWIDDSE
ncbi:hypothetical protein EJ110_NYTH13140 [Nymphaea thermarum]|nr:hypothetical protein EJ110_NYTH13140 [Nymphaea thermarum]